MDSKLLKRIMFDVLATTLLAFCFLLPWEAGAALETSIEFRYSTDATRLTPPSGTELRGEEPWNVLVTASAPAAMKSFGLRLTSTDSSIPPLGSGSSVEKTYSLVPTTNDSITMPWSPRLMTPYNGTYRLEATTTSMLGEITKASVENIYVNDPPASVVGLKLVLDDGLPVPSWSANREPDIIGYDVYRIAGGGAPVKLARITQTALKDANAPKGIDLAYQVVAVRKSPLGDKTISSQSAITPNVVSIALPVSAAGLTDPLPSAPVADKAPSGPKVDTPRPVAIKDDGSFFGHGFEATLPYSSAGRRSNSATGGQALTAGPWEAMLQPATQPLARTEAARYGAAGLVLLVSAMHLVALASRITKGNLTPA